MARRQTRAAAEPCPCCTAEAIIRHVLIACPLNAEGVRMVWEKRGSKGKVIVADFGVLAIEHATSPARLTVTVLGEAVLVATKERNEVLLPGPWQAMLEAIAAVLVHHHSAATDVHALN